MRRIAMLVLFAFLAICAPEGDPESSGHGGDAFERRHSRGRQGDLDADRELADGALLSTDGVPASFEEEPDDEARSAHDCIGIDHDEISVEVVGFASEAEVQQLLDVWRDPDTQDCFADAMHALAAEAQDRVELGEVTLEELVIEGLGDDAFGFELEMPFVADGVERAFYVAVMLIQQGRTVIALGYDAFDAPFDAEAGHELGATLVHQVAADA